MRKIFISLLLVLILLAPLVPTRAAHAQIPVTVTSDAPFWSKEFGLDFLARILARMVSQMFTNATVEWLRSGGKGGGPLFVTDFNAFVKDAANEASGAFITNLGLSDLLCGPFPLAFDISFWGGSSRSNPYDRFDCTIEDVVANMEDWQREFSNGGWEAWNEILKPHNRGNSAYLLAMDAAISLGSDAEGETGLRASASGGLLGQQKCEPIDVPLGNGESVTDFKCTVTTPGDAIHGSLTDAFGKNADWLFSVDEINELVVAFADFAVTNLFESDDGILGGGAREDVSGSNRPISSARDTLTRALTRLVNLLNRSANIVEEYISNTLQSRRDEIRNGTCAPFDTSPSCYYTTENGGCDPTIVGDSVLRACPILFEYEGEMVNARQLLNTLRSLSSSVEYDIQNTIPTLRTFDDLKEYSATLTLLWNSARNNIRTSEGVMREGQIEETENKLEDLESILDQYAIAVNQ